MKYFLFLAIGVFIYIFSDQISSIDLVGKKISGNDFKVIGSAIFGATIVQSSDVFFSIISKFLKNIRVSVKTFISLCVNKEIDKMINFNLELDNKNNFPPVLILIDTEGVSTPINRSNLNLSSIIMYRAYLNKIKTHKKTKVILNTGRSQGYVELLCQVLGIADDQYYNIPHIMENGMALYNSYTKESISLLDSQQIIEMHEIEDKLEKKFNKNLFEPKKYMITINPINSENMQDLYEKIVYYMTKIKKLKCVDIHKTYTAVEINYKGIDKAYALDYIVNNYYDKNDEVIKNTIIISSNNSDLSIIENKNIKNAYCPTEKMDRDTEQRIIEKFNSKSVLEKHNGSVFSQVVEKECKIKKIK